MEFLLKCGHIVSYFDIADEEIPRAARRDHRYTPCVSDRTTTIQR
jgi:hypothetical protein